MNPSTWLSDRAVADSGLPSSGPVDSDLSDDEDSGPTRGSGSSVNLLSAFLSWVRSAVPTSPSHSVYLVFEGKTPRQVVDVGVKVLEDYLDTRSRSISSVTINGTPIPQSARCVCIRGPPGAGKSAALFELAREHTALWLYPHEIMNCELGESGRIVRNIFQKAAAARPSIVLMDDADLTLNSSGKIVKEIVEEIGNCVTDFGVFFIFSLSHSHIDPFIMSKVDIFITL